jgi:hypothetical protein
MRKSIYDNKTVLLPTKINGLAFIEDIHLYFKNDSDTVLKEFEIRQVTDKG